MAHRWVRQDPRSLEKGFRCCSCHSVSVPVLPLASLDAVSLSSNPSGEDRPRRPLDVVFLSSIGELIDSDSGGAASSDSRQPVSANRFHSPGHPYLWRRRKPTGLNSRREMGEPSFFDRMLAHLRSTSKYYTGYPKDLGPSRIIHFTSERQFVQLLHEGHPVVVAFTIRCPYTKHLDKVLEEAAAEFYPHIKFVRVECPKYPGFCITRQRKEYPFIEIFHTPEQATSQGRVVDPSITKYSVKVLPFNYDQSAYGFREFFKRNRMHVPDSK